MVFVMEEEKIIKKDPEKGTREYAVAYKNGIIDGLTRYSWWEDGIQYVGTAKKTLELAIQEIEKEFEWLKP